MIALASSGTLKGRVTVVATALALMWGASSLADAQGDRPNFSGMWHYQSIYTAQGTPLTLRNTDWAPLSAGRPEDRKAVSFEERQAQTTARLAAVQAGRTPPPGEGPFRPPFTAAGEEAAKAIPRERPFGERRDWTSCLPRNRVGVSGPMQIAQLPDRILILGDNNNRTIYLAGDNSDTFPSYAGTSQGRFVGNALVVTTTNFKGSEINGWPISEEVKITETFTMSSDRKLLTIKTVYEDPKYLKEPLARMSYADPAPKVRLMEADCLETLRDSQLVDALNPVAGDVPATPAR